MLGLGGVRSSSPYPLLEGVFHALRDPMVRSRMEPLILREDPGRSGIDSGMEQCSEEYVSAMENATGIPGHLVHAHAGFRNWGPSFDVGFRAQLCPFDERPVSVSVEWQGGDTFFYVTFDGKGRRLIDECQRIVADTIGRGLGVLDCFLPTSIRITSIRRDGKMVSGILVQSLDSPEVNGDFIWPNSRVVGGL
jgi:hypothetical protein